MRRAIDRRDIGAKELVQKLDYRLTDVVPDDGVFVSTYFYGQLAKRFASGNGYYGWSGLRYFLYEYELSLLDASRQKKVDWNDLLKTAKDKISIEHIYPQTETDGWATSFKTIAKENRSAYGGSVGNLLLLSMAINSALQNDSFLDKKHAKFDSLEPVMKFRLKSLKTNDLGALIKVST